MSILQCRSGDMGAARWRLVIPPAMGVLLSLRGYSCGCDGDDGAPGEVLVRFVYSYLEKSGWSSSAGVASLLGDMESPAGLGAPGLLRLGDGIGRSAIKACIDLVGVPLVAKVGFKKLDVASSSEASSSSWSSASSRMFGVPFVQEGSDGWRLRSPVTKTTGDELQGLVCICFSFKNVLVICQCTLVYQ
ncbi:unnamed protein product [Urochloa humidicola]